MEAKEHRISRYIHLRAGRGVYALAGRYLVVRHCSMPRRVTRLNYYYLYSCSATPHRPLPYTGRMPLCYLCLATLTYAHLHTSDCRGLHTTTTPPATYTPHQSHAPALLPTLTTSPAACVHAETITTHMQYADHSLPLPTYMHHDYRANSISFPRSHLLT